MSLRPAVGQPTNSTQRLTSLNWCALCARYVRAMCALCQQLDSQLSGRLVARLPASLHQLSLEDNNWACDCRLLALKRWLLASKVPLAAPVRCQRRVGGRTASGGSTQPLTLLEAPQFIEQMSLDEFACAPRVSKRLLNATLHPSPLNQSATTPTSAHWPDFGQIIDYFAAPLSELRHAGSAQDAFAFPASHARAYSGAGGGVSQQPPATSGHKSQPSKAASVTLAEGKCALICICNFRFGCSTALTVVFARSIRRHARATVRLCCAPDALDGRNLASRLWKRAARSGSHRRRRVLAAEHA